MSRFTTTLTAAFVGAALVASTLATPAANAQPRPAAYYQNCDAARSAGAAPIYRGQDGYRPGLDRDGDGVACETGNAAPPAAPRVTPKPKPRPPRSTPAPKPKPQPKRASNISRQFDRIHYVFCTKRRTGNLIKYQDFFGNFQTRHIDLNNWNGRQFCGFFDSIELNPRGHFVWGSVRNDRSPTAFCELRINGRVVARENERRIGWAIC
ncbi:MAG: excalibur calcium-binding domain-containing protein [Gordonia sp. (in: high G+C Gram-positive bacteria)]|nr:excalibur calcium-binding domain-containing protein [Gordonia sp. (in: high G+C Gram-positive bacteria)]